MPRTITVELYQYSELSDKAKAKARDWWREMSAPDTYFSESVIEDFQTVAKACGFSIGTTPGRRTFPAIYWEGFSHQGQGASFDASWAARNVDNAAIDALRVDRPAVFRDAQGAEQRCETNAELHALLIEIIALAKQDRSATGTVKASRRGHNLECDYYNGRHDFTGAFDTFCVGFAHWLFRNLEREYDYQNSDEVVADNIEANGYEFTIEGKRA